MPFRITARRDATGHAVQIDGRLDADGVAELERLVTELAGPVRLELAELRSADEAGVKALRTLRDRGTPLIGVSHYLRLLMERRTDTQGRSSRKTPRAGDAGG